MSASFSYPTQLQFDSNENLIICDSSSKLIRIINREGVVSTLTGSAGIGFVDGSGILWLKKVIEAKFSYPWGIFIDKQGRIWIGDSGSNAIRLITSDYQNVYTVAGLSSAGHADGNVDAAQFSRSWQFFITSSGVCLIADGDNNMIRGIKFSFDLTSTTNKSPSKLSDAEKQSSTKVTTYSYNILKVPTTSILSRNLPDIDIKPSADVISTSYNSESTTPQSSILIPSQSIISRNNCKNISLTPSLYKSESTFIPSSYILKYMNTDIKSSASASLSMYSHADKASYQFINSQEYTLNSIFTTTPSQTVEFFFETIKSVPTDSIVVPTETISAKIILSDVLVENSTISQNNATLRYNHISAYDMLYYSRLLPEDGGLLCYSLILLGLAFVECAKIVKILLLKFMKRKSIVYIASMLGVISTVVNWSFYVTYITMDIVYEKISVQTISTVALSLSISNITATFFVYSLIAASIIQFHMVY